METQTVHFTIGEDMGRTLQQIAYEHLVCNNDFDKAMNTLALGEGCDDQMKIELLTGKKIIMVDVETQEFIVCDREDYPELDDVYPKLDVLDYCKKMQSDTDDRCADLEEGLGGLENLFLSSSVYRLNFSVDAVMKYIYGDNKDMIAEIEDNDELNHWQMLIKITLEFVQLALKKSWEVRKLLKYFPDIDFVFDTYNVTELASALQRIARSEFNAPVVDDNVTDYIEAVKDIDEVLSTGIEPVDILDNYSAGWLSPEGDYYALNGEIANMLHNTIGEALQEKGVIPIYDSEDEKELDMKTNPDSWLEQQGWVKIHENWILYGGMFNDKLGKENVPMTDVQRQMIGDYIDDCHQCQVKLGFRQEMFSVGQFRAMDSIALHKKFEL